MVALILMSLIHVPINIPAFALSTKVDVDMNQELIAHGYSNIVSGAFGGLQNYMAYTQSVLYDKSSGTGRISGVAVAILTGVLFFVGPTVATYIPRCMAGTLLLHVGIDLFLEGVWDTFGKFDVLEYSGIWLIVTVMTVYGMEAAMVAGGIAAVSTYAAQSVAYLTPIRGVMPATTLRSSHWNRSHGANEILDDPSDGRSRILVVQLQGHLFFGNMASFTEQIHGLLQKGSSQGRGGGTIRGKNEAETPIVLILDCSLVLGIDSSAAQGIAKLRDIVLTLYQIQLCIFVTGSPAGFPTEYNLTEQLSSKSKVHSAEYVPDLQPNEDTALVAKHIQDHEEQLASKFRGSRVCVSLDQALMVAEDAMIARQDPSQLVEDSSLFPPSRQTHDGSLSSAEEREECVAILKLICPTSMSDTDSKLLCSLFEREVYKQDNFVWKQNDPSDSVKLVLSGQLVAEIENEAGTTEVIPKRSIIGELGLVNGNPRMSSVRCISSEVVLYSMSLASFQRLVDSHPGVARHMDLICIKYLALRVQHVSNRIFETRCLPI
jgi:sulfate permease, SulP family